MLDLHHGDEMRDTGMTHNQLLQDLSWRLGNMLDRQLSDFGLPEPKRPMSRVQRDAKHYPATDAAGEQAGNNMGALHSQQHLVAKDVLQIVGNRSKGGFAEASSNPGEDGHSTRDCGNDHGNSRP